MNRTIIAIICAAVIALAALIAVYTIDIPVRYLLSSEKIGKYEIAAMRTSSLNHAASVTLGYEDTYMLFPLPNGAVPFENKEYPVSEGVRQYLIRVEALDHYLHNILREHGYEFDQLGSWISVKSEENFIHIGIKCSMFTRDFMRFELTIDEQMDLFIADYMRGYGVMEE